MCLQFPASLTDVLMLLLSAGTLYEHVPWLARFAKAIPGMAEDIKRMRKMGLQRAATRTKRGSTTKDVFYYLVRAAQVPELAKLTPVA